MVTTDSDVTLTPPLDPRLDRLPEFDEASRRFGVRELLPQAPPRSYTWACKTWLDQGQEGACTGFSWGHLAAARPRPRAMDNAGAEAIYHRARQLDQYPGEDYEGSSVLGAAKACVDFGYITSYHWAFSVDELAHAVGYVGPAVLGINWYAGMAQTNDAGFVEATGALLGGHAILCNGVDVKRRSFRLHNSWGPQWGVAGECLVSYADIDRLLHEQGEAAIGVVKKKAAR